MPPNVVILTGPPGSGKTTLAPLVASRLGYEAVDTDRRIEEVNGCSVAELFAREGERTFRAHERALLHALLLRERVVIAVGGGALVDRALRHNALRRALVVALDAPPDVLLARVQAGQPRPLVTASLDPRGALDALLDARREAYAEAHLRVDTARATSPGAVVDDIVAACERPPLVMPLGERTYRVHFDALARLAGTVDLVAAQASSALVAVTDRTVSHHWGDAIRKALGRKAAATVRLNPGESSKDLRNLAKVWDAALAAGVDRDALVVCAGGGVVTDLGGFAAATLLRGVRYLSVPTTLLAMVDASVGGKTAIDHRRGKNLVGAFHHPSAVWVDPAFLTTLPKRQYRAGMAEVVKMGVALDASLLDLVEAHAAQLAEPPTADESPDVARVRERMIRMAVQAKIDVVALDERESGVRALLNFGHTVGHAVEAASNYGLLHGECVAIGVVAALDLGASLGTTPPALVGRVSRLLDALKLPRTATVRRDRVLRHLLADKKRDRASLRFVLATDAGQAVVRKVEWEAIERAVDRVVVRAPKRDY